MLESLDFNSLVSAVAGGAAVYAGIKADLALLKYKYDDLKKRFEDHEKKAAH
jgi:hypothetical protein